MVGQCQQYVLDGQVLVAHVDALAVSGLEGLTQCAVDGGLGPAEGLGEPAQLVTDAGPDHRGLHADAGQDGGGDPVGLVEYGGQQVVGGHLGVRGVAGALDGGGQRLLGLQRPAFGVQAHREPPFP